MRKLTLKKESLVELTGTELDNVVGGVISGVSCPVCSDFRACLPPTLDYCVQTLKAC